MITLSKRQVKIIDFLEKKLEWITINSIATTFEVSERTIRNDLDSIASLLKGFDVNLEKKPKVGVRLVLKKGQSIDSILKSYDNKVYSPEERALMISVILIIKGNSTIEELMNYVKVSKNTLVSDLKLSESKLREYGIEVSKKSYYGISVNDNSYEKLADGFLKLYRLLANGQEREVHNHLYNESSLDETKVKKIIEGIEKINDDVEFSDESLEVLELALLFTLCKAKEEEDLRQDTLELLNEEEEIKKLRNSIKDVVSKNIDNEKLRYLLKILKGSRRTKNFTWDGKSEKDEIVDKVLNEFYQIIDIDNHEDIELRRQMEMHLNTAIYRIQNNLVIDNPMIEEIKYKMSFIYEITEKILNSKSDIIGVKFPEAEIAYMAMYFEVLFEKHVKGNLDSKVLIVCNGGLATSSLLKSRMNLMIPEAKIESICRMKDVDSYLKDNNNIDFIVSTVPLKMEDYKVIQVNPLLEPTDIEKIKSEIYKKWHEKNCKYLIKTFKEETNEIIKVIPKEYTQFDLAIDDWREAIEIAAEPLVKSNKIKRAYIKDMIRSVEELGNYMVFIPGIAFVHAFAENVNETSVSLLTLKSTIDFGSKSKVDVKAIVVLANKEESKNLINIVNVLTKGDNINKFKNAVNYEEIEMLV